MPESSRLGLGEIDESSGPERPSLSAHQAAQPDINSTKRSHHASRSARKDASTAPQSGPVFTDDPLTAGITIKAIHITELRDAINQARAHASLLAASWAEAITPGVTVKASHITEMRARIDEARTALGLAAASYTDPSLAAGTIIKAVHIQELRQRVTETLATNLAIPRDGHASLNYDTASNRITTDGFAYDAAGNQVRALIPDGMGSQRYRYDAANRLAQVRTDDNNTVIAAYTYGHSNERLVAEEGSARTYYVSEGGATTSEYTEFNNSGIVAWAKTYIYLGNRLLSTVTPNGAGGEAVEYHHPDRLGTRIVTNPSTGSWSEQVTLPFGTALGAESSGTPTNRRFTSYDRSTTTGLDYAVNRQYDSQQGRFTQVDPAGMRATTLISPQTLNLYAYCTNDPINQIDPSGLGLFSFLKKAFRGIAKFIAKVLTNKWVLLIAGIALGVLSGFAFYLAFSYATVNTTFLAYGIALAAMSALLIVGAYHQGFLRVVRTISGISGTITGIVGLVNHTINGSVFGTPPWNPNRRVGFFLEGEEVPEDGVLRFYIWAPKWHQRLASGIAVGYLLILNAVHQAFIGQSIFDTVTVRGDEITLSKNPRKFDVCDIFDAATVARAENPETWPTVKFATGVGLGVAAQEVGAVGALVAPDLAYVMLRQKCNTARICCITKQCPCTVKNY
jgi:RHS repeat-associated protein